jgi:branched-chain amino acid aminotransferase
MPTKNTVRAESVNRLLCIKPSYPFIPRALLTLPWNLLSNLHTMESVNAFYILDRVLISTDTFDDSFLSSGINLYEVVKVVEGIPLFLSDHLERMNASAQKLDLTFRACTPETFPLIRQLFKANSQDTGNVKMVLHLEKDTGKQFFILYQVPHFYPPPEMYHKGADLVLLKEERPDPGIKNWRPGFKQRIAKMKNSSGAYEVLLMNESEVITEGSQSNFFIIAGNEIITAPKELVLSGITRKYVFEICRDLNIPIREKEYGLPELEKANAAFLTGTSPGILPVGRIDELKLNTTHPLLASLRMEFENLVREDLRRMSGSDSGSGSGEV